MKASSLSCAGPVDSGLVNGVRPVGRGGEAGCSIRKLSCEVGGWEMNVMGSGWNRNGTVAGYPSESAPRPFGQRYFDETHGERLG